MASRDDIVLEITPQLLLRAYACGIFPMSEDKDDPGIFWVEPEMRGIIPLDEFHVSRSLRKSIRKSGFKIRVNTAFDEVVSGCAGEGIDRDTTWISGRIRSLYRELHKMGRAHSVECWLGDELVGGLYGVCLAGAFFGESMFSRRTDASKIALVDLVERLNAGGFALLDTQFSTEHLEKFGAVEIPRDDYRELLDDALTVKADFFAIDK